MSSRIRADTKLPQTGPARRRNRRGQGERLREEILEAASAMLAESGDVKHLTLRGVARRVGIAAPSVYLHFADVDQLALAVTERRFPELGAAIAASTRGIRNPVEALVAGSLAYCRFAVEHPGHYRVLFDADLAARTQTESGRRVFEQLAHAVQRCFDAGARTEQELDATLTAAVLWSALHGMVSLRISRPAFPWPPLDRMVGEAVRRQLALGLTSIVQ